MKKTGYPLVVIKMRASSLVCLLGVGIGFSSYLLYRFWNKIFSPGTPPKPQLPPVVKRKTRPNTPTSLAGNGGDLTAERSYKSPDSGFQTMGNTDSNPASTSVTPSSPTINQNAIADEKDEPKKMHHGELDQLPDDISESEYESFVVINRGQKSGMVQSESSSKSESSSQSTICHGEIEKLQMSSSQEECRETLSTIYPEKEALALEQTSDGGNMSHGHPMYASMTSTMQGSIMSTASTDLGFVSGNNEHSRETSVEPGQYSLESFNPSFQLHLDYNSNPANHQGPRGRTPMNTEEMESAKRLHKLQTMQDLTSFSEGGTPQKYDYSLTEFINHPTHMSDSSVMYSFLEDSSGSSDIPRPHSEMMVTPPVSTRAMSEGGHHSEPEMTFAGAPVKHSTPQCENSEEVFKIAMKAPTKKHAFSNRIKKTHSFTSEMSTTSDASYYLWGGNSIDMGENFSGRSTPDIDALKSLDFLGGKTEEDINDIQNQIQGLRAEIDEMSERVQTLSSRDNLSYLPEIDGVSEVIRGSRMPRLSQIRKRYVSQVSNDTCSVQSLNLSEDGSELKRSASQNQGDFMWDYQSDLASGIHQNFVARRPVVGNIVEDAQKERSESPVPDQMKKYLQQQSDSVNFPTTDCSRNVSDLYIDDGFSFHQSYFPARSKVQVSHVGVMATGGLSPVVESRNPVGESDEVVSDKKKSGAAKSEKLCSECKSDCCSNCGKSINLSNNNNNSSKGKYSSSDKSETKITHSTQTESDREKDDSVWLNIKCRTSTNLNDRCCTPHHIHQCHSHCRSPVASCENCHNPTVHCVESGQIGTLCARQSNETRMALTSCSGYRGNLSPGPSFCHAPVTTVTTTPPSHQPRGHPISVSTPACCHGNQSSCLRRHSGCNVSLSQASHNSGCGYHTPLHQHNHQICPHAKHALATTFKGDSLDGSFLDYSAVPHARSAWDETDSAVDSGMSQEGGQFGAVVVAAGSPMVCSPPGVIHQEELKVENAETLNNNVINNQKHLPTSAISTPASDCVKGTGAGVIGSDYSKKSSERVKWEVTNIGTRHQISDYVKKEWKGSTGNAETMRKGYEHIPSRLGLSSLRVIRGDNYCALRSTLYQILVNRLPVQNHLGSLESILEKLDVFKSETHSYLHSWTFANRLPHDKTQVYKTAKECVQTLFDQLQICWNLENSTEREHHLIESLNSDPELDLRLLEAVKCLMMVNAVKLYEKNQNGEDVPVFVWLLFARDTSESPEQFLRNHLNHVGDSAGLEQVEMFLLGYTLGVRITVVRPSQFTKEDYITHFPSEGADSYPRVHLVAEDDRHYNALV